MKKDDEELGERPPSQAGPIEFLLRLESVYGWKLLALLAVSQWLVKGVIYGFTWTTADFLLREYAVPGPQMQIYKAVANLPWAMKPVFGWLSDACPILNYRRGPYIVISTIAAVGAYAALGIYAPHGLSVREAVLCLVLGSVHTCVSDLLTEARYSEKMRERPEYGPDLITYVWVGITVGWLVSAASVGFIIEYLGVAVVFLIVAVLASFMIVPVVLGWLEEPRADSLGRSRVGTELTVLVIIIGSCSLLMLLAGLLQDSVRVNFLVALCCAVLVAGALLFLLKPLISLVVVFFFFQNCAALDVSGAAFYFFTDDATQYPDGPHFSKVFFASGLGVVVALLNLVGMFVYNRYMQHWRYHGMLLFANSLLCVVNVMGMIVYTRLNVVWGISDMLFVIAAWGAWAVVSMWMYMPATLLVSQLCPRGLEATMFALVAGCHNLGSACAGYFGAYLLELLHVEASGAPGEEKQFENLWIASLVSAILPMVTVSLLPWMVPNGKQTEMMLAPGDSVVEGSPFSRWFCSDSADEREVTSEALHSEKVPGSAPLAYGAVSESGGLRRTPSTPRIRQGVPITPPVTPRGRGSGLVG